MNAGTKTSNTTASSEPQSGSRFQSWLRSWRQYKHSKRSEKEKSVSYDSIHARRIAEALRQEAYEVTYNPQQWFYKVQLNTVKVIAVYSVIFIIACILVGIAGVFTACLL